LAFVRVAVDQFVPARRMLHRRKPEEAEQAKSQILKKFHNTTFDKQRESSWTTSSETARISPSLFHASHKHNRGAEFGGMRIDNLEGIPIQR